MKKYLIIILAVINVMIISSCSKKKDPDPTTQSNNSHFTNTPEAKAVNDNKSGGIYKGVLKGSSGTVKMILQDNNVSAVVTFDGVTKTLTTNSLNSWTSGQAISNAIFISGDWQLTFSVDADGLNPQLAVSIPGHTVEVVLIKETSSSLVRTFEGNYTKADTTSFVLNCVIIGNQVSFVGFPSKGVLTGDSISLGGSSENGFRLAVSLYDDVISGPGSSDKIIKNLDPQNNVTYDTVRVSGFWNANRTR